MEFNRKPFGLNTYSNRFYERAFISPRIIGATMQGDSHKNVVTIPGKGGVS